ncbi:LysR substrate-binding domain-containing protein [Solilutibacter tolerans]|uniref:DNA-binding transcriptional regulator, LysR family n=1 Tax=Solilutibacter tolerans TaxID=1604334 RepID=A0A1N6XPA5_9GAMM|nr:DNA-binding transcriptional regulator, LysR family [Lysobacter tolerans]
MQDLNDLYYFSAVVEHGGYAAAERALGIPKSRLSRRIAQLESDLGVRLLQRSTRSFAVTDIGHSVFRHAQAMLASAQAARDTVDRVSSAPRGLVRVSVPVTIAQEVMPRVLPSFLERYPDVRVQVHVSNRRIDLINEGFDIALRVRARLDEDGSLVLRGFGESRELLLASPAYLDKHGRPKLPSDLKGHSVLMVNEDESQQRWELHGPDDAVETVDIKPRLVGFDFPMLKRLAMSHIGISMLPEMVCADAVRDGDLEVVLPDWHLPQGIVHAVFASRRGLLPAVRVFIDHLAETVPAAMNSLQIVPSARPAVSE